MKRSVDRHVLYEASVQGTDVDIALFEKIFRSGPKRAPLTLREDFCGTALLARDWVASDPRRLAWGVDLHRPTLNWARKHRLSTLSEADRERVHLLEENVLNVSTPAVDLIAALNFSYMIFRERATLLQYFRSVYSGLVDDGVFVLDLFGGPHAQKVMTEQKSIPAGRDIEDTPYPAFKYFWEQARFNAVDQSILCHIHFKGRDLVPQTRAFSYTWRLWSITELRDLLSEAGFSRIDSYFEGWSDAHGSSDGVLRKRTRYEGMDAWVAYLAAYR
ncbi:MAG: class I SAM-dependent methyltransferase [Verrucomicrobia bacterium]|nr:class I SAM-dependent methyltransferase [Verrucomicrobiota bacterium]MCH8525703.1 class I SAM-dependent methyltransferase [Kiritimatiellia bacterium]